MAGELQEDKLETNLSLLPWTNTKQALSHLQELLKCNICSQLPSTPQYMGRCDHFFCESCIVKLADDICPVCKISSLPCERKQDIIVQGLVHSVNELCDLINGAQRPLKKGSIEAPSSFLIPQDPIQSGSINFQSASDAKIVKSDSLETSSTGSMEAQPKLNDAIFENESASTMNPSFKKKKMKENIYKNTRNVDQKNVNSTPFSLKSRKMGKPLLDSIKEQSPVMNSAAKFKDLSTDCIALTSPVINKKNLKGETPLHSACLKGSVARVRALLEEGANPNTKDNAGWTPLHEACSQGFDSIANLLLEHGAQVDVPGHCNMTPLHDAIISEACSIISLLRRWGASDTQRDMWNRTARSLVSITKQPDKVKLALDTPRDPLMSAKSIQPPLQNKITVLDSNLSPESKKKLEKLGKVLKVKVVNEFSDDVTHIVVGCTQNKKLCPRTIKYMMGVVSGKWILSHEWIDACLAQCYPVNPLEYEMEGPLSTPSCFAPHQGRVKASKMLPGLFSGCHIYFYGSFGDSFPTKKELEALVKAGSGIPLQREPNPESIHELEQTVPFHVEVDSPLAKCSHFCIYMEGPHEPQLKYDMAHIKSLPLSWLYDSIDHWNLVNPTK